MSEEKLPTEFAPAERGTEEEIKRQADLFSASPLTRLFNYIPDIVLVLNRYRQIVYANKTASRLFCLTGIDSIQGLRPGELLDCVHSHESKGGCGTTAFCSQCGAIKAILSSLRGMEDIQECRVTQKNSGNSLDLRVWAYPASLENEDITVFIASDISNEKRKEVLQRIFYHDISNTVGNLRGFSEILKDATPDDAEEFRGIIYDLTGRLTEEINTHRELEAAESGKLPVNPELLDSLRELHDVQNLYKRAEIAENRQIVITAETEKIEFTSDRILLTRVLSNMVKNALEASSPGDTITLSAERIGDSVQFSVSNPAVMPREIQLQIFQRSFSTKGPGRGIGTYSMRLLSENYLKGNVSFTSTEEQGTTFYARYPLVFE